MGYTIAQVTKRTGLTAHTLRYYDKEGLLPFVERTQSGIRDFKESDFDWLGVITCLKDCGMPIKNIKQYIDWCFEGDVTLQKRLEMFETQKKIVEEKIAELQHHMKKIDFKIRYYKTSIEAGTEAIHDKNECAECK